MKALVTLRIARYQQCLLQHTFLYKTIIIILLCASWVGSSAQADSLFKQYLHPDGTVSSEGYLVDGRPEGAWKTFYPDGTLKSEGERKDFKLSGTWSFYGPDGALVNTIEYQDDRKNGVQRKYGAGQVLISEEHFVDGVKQGPSLTYYPDGQLASRVLFKAGKEEGTAYEYAEDGRPITLTEWRDGVLQSRREVNRYDDRHRRQGAWMGYYPDGRLKWEGRFVDGRKQGIFKEYDKQGGLKDLVKYDQGELLVDEAQTMLLDIKNTYHANGQVATVGTYTKSGTKEGLFRRYDTAGSPLDARIYQNDQLMAEGAVSVAGAMNGHWTEYYQSGEKRAEGGYKDGKKDGPWTFFHKQGTVEQRGNYKDGLPQGEWRWYYNSGELHREEFYRRGREDGLSVEYERDGSVIVKGNYIDGLRDGEWFYHVGGHTEKGAYRDGLRDGQWTGTYDNGKRYFSGAFISGERNGRHRWFWPNGRLKLEGRFSMGLEQGDFNYFDPEGRLRLTIRYKDGKEMRLDNEKLPPPYESVGYAP